MAVEEHGVELVDAVVPHVHVERQVTDEVRQACNSDVFIRKLIC